MTTLTTTFDPNLLDFDHEIRQEPYSAYGALDQPGYRWIVPQRLALATRNNGLADLQLTITRALLPRPRTYGVLDLRLVADGDPAAILALSNTATPVTVRPALPTGGHLRLSFGETRFTQPLAWNGLKQTRLHLQLSADEISVVRRALTDGVLLPQATAALAIAGYATRAAAIATFDPSALLGCLQAAYDHEGNIDYAQLQHFIATRWHELPVQWQVAPHEPPIDALAQQQSAFLDRLIARFATLVSPPTDEPLAYLTLPTTTQAGSVQWRLDDQLITWRPIVLQWHPLTVVREQIAHHGVEPFLQEVDVPPLPTDTVEVTVVGNLPTERSNVLSVGAYLTVPPQLPWRPHSVQATAVLAPPEDSTTVRLRLGMRMALAYQCQPFIVLTTATDFRTLLADEQRSSATTVELSVADFPVTFYSLTAEPALLALAHLQGVLVWEEETGKQQVPFELSEQMPVATIAVPNAAAVPIVEATAHALTTEIALPLAPLPATDGYLTLWQLPTFGAHTIRFTVTTAPPVPLAVAVETADGTAEVQLFLRADRPTIEWHYVALDPFHAGFRYRLSPDGQWSSMLSPLEHKEIRL